MAPKTGLDWLLDDLCRRVAHVRHALVLSEDGMVTAHSQDLERPDAEHLAAVSSGLHSLAKGSGGRFAAGGVRQTMIEFDAGHLLIASAGSGSCLSVLTAAETDIAQVAHEMALMVNRVGEHLAVDARKAP
ncbi:roadblock/LC7 domain-containing protein [Streptomyces sp. TR06-5]|uniref:roadblock/LC7 domain-containing protein n=1 Tax=unclassified Streptomyces TaxID=2593676 RepID=UPI00399F2387